MVPPEVIAFLKLEYGQIFSAQFGEYLFVIRPLNYKEYKELISAQSEDWSSTDVEDQLVLSATLWPELESLDDLPAGVVSSLADEIVEVSAFNSIESALEMLEVARQEVLDAHKMMKTFVISAQPAYTEEMLDELTFKQLADKVAMSEAIFDLQGQVVNAGEVKLRLFVPEEEQEQQPIAKPSFTEEDLEKEIRRSKNPDAETKGSTLGTAPINDPIARKLWEALHG